MLFSMSSVGILEFLDCIRLRAIVNCRLFGLPLESSCHGGLPLALGRKDTVFQGGDHYTHRGKLTGGGSMELMEGIPSRECFDTRYSNAAVFSEASSR